MNIRNIGWDAAFADSFAVFAAQGLRPSRVVMRNRDLYWLIGSDGEYTARLSGKIKRQSAAGGIIPVVGDWVAVLEQDGFYGAMIQAVVPRRSGFSRKQAGRSSIEQALAANIDTVFIVAGLDGNFNISRLERYLAVAHASLANPVILLNKSDACADPESCKARAADCAPGTPIHCISAASGIGLEQLGQYMAAGRTLAFLGSSGVGKSTIINRLFGENRQATGATSEHNGKGRHTTTGAELIPHESGCLLLDTPGLRELTLWCDESTLDESFADIQKLIGSCRFSNCRHLAEPGCAIRDALASGRLAPKRFANYQKMQVEVQALGIRKMQKEEYLARLNKQEKLRGLKDYDRENC